MKKRQGFTIIEVALFIAISGLILMGVIISTNNSINQQHYNDSVQSFADFLRGIYSQVSNPKSSGKGNSDFAIYGKLVTFGENDGDTIHTYDVIGNADGVLGGSSVAETLTNLQASPFIKIKNNNNTFTTSLAGLSESYTPTWGAKVFISTIANGELAKLAKKAALLIVRSPMSGTIYTLVMTGETIEVQQILDKNNSEGSGVENIINNPSTQFEEFTIKDIDFCLKAEGVAVFGDVMRNIRILSNAHNSSSVNLIDVSAGIGINNDQNRCDKSKEQ